MDARDGGLLAWQWRLYEQGHRSRTNLLLHALTNPLFLAGTVAFASAAFVSPWLFAAGPGAMAFAMALQGRGHRGEAIAPVPFRGPGDVVLRILAEQWITFPRFVVTGGFGRAWRGAA